MSSNAIVALGRSMVAGLALATILILLPANGQADPVQPQQMGAEQATGAIRAPSSVLKSGIGVSSPAVANEAVQSNSTSTPQAAGASVPAGTIGTPVGSNASAGTTSVSAIQPKIDGLELLTPAQRRAFERASSTFTSFCHDWERLLHERELNNLDHLSWRADGGLEMASYTGYGKVESCECKESQEGLPIGKIRYLEMNYSIAGKTIDEARHALPKLTHQIETLEIFSWDKGKWFY